MCILYPLHGSDRLSSLSYHYGEATCHTGHNFMHFVTTSCLSHHLLGEAFSDIGHSWSEFQILERSINMRFSAGKRSTRQSRWVDQATRRLCNDFWCLCTKLPDTFPTPNFYLFGWEKLIHVGCTIIFQILSNFLCLNLCRQWYYATTQLVGDYSCPTGLLFVYKNLAVL